MHIPITPLLGSVAALPRPRQLHADLQRTAAPLHHPRQAAGTVLTRSIVWALIAIAVWVSLLGLSALSTAGTAQSPPSHRAHATHRPPDSTTPSGIRTPGREPHDTSSPPATASTSQA